jgi:hypothetical protein
MPSVELDLPLDEIKRLYVDEGWTTYGIARIFDCAPGTISSRLKAMGISPRDSSKVLGALSNEERARRYLADATAQQAPEGRDVKGDCLISNNGTDKAGYGKVGVGGKTLKAHRFIYKALVDPDLPDEVKLDHLCRVTACINPDHLEPVSLLHWLSYRYRG